MNETTKLELHPILENDGDIFITVKENKLKIVCRIDDAVQKVAFSQMLMLQEKKVVPMEVLEHYFNKPEAEQVFVDFVNDCNSFVHTTDLEDKTFSHVLYNFICFMDFRFHVMELRSPPKVVFGTLQNEKEWKNITVDTPKNLTSNGFSNEN